MDSAFLLYFLFLFSLLSSLLLSSPSLLSFSFQKARKYEELKSAFQLSSYHTHAHLKRDPQIVFELAVSDLLI